MDDVSQLAEPVGGCKMQRIKNWIPTAVGISLGIIAMNVSANYGRSHFPEASWYVIAGADIIAFMIVYIFTVFVVYRLGVIYSTYHADRVARRMDEHS